MSAMNRGISASGEKPFMQGAEEAPGALDEKAADDGYDPTEGKVVTEEEQHQQAEKFNADISSRMKDKGDLFDEMVLHEEQIRLGEAGWKTRYYQVLPQFPTKTCMSVRKSTERHRCLCMFAASALHVKIVLQAQNSFTLTDQMLQGQSLYTRKDPLQACIADQNILDDCGVNGVYPIYSSKKYPDHLSLCRPRQACLLDSRSLWSVTW